MAENTNTPGNKKKLWFIVCGVIIALAIIGIIIWKLIIAPY